MKHIFSHSLFLGCLFASGLYIEKFNKLSETELVRMSYIWIPLIVFGIAGKLAMSSGRLAHLENPIKAASIIALKWTVGMMLLLIAFYEVLWDQL